MVAPKKPNYACFVAFGGVGLVALVVVVLLMVGPTTTTTTAASTTQLPFNCNTMEVWTEAKKAWCCANENKGCTTTPEPKPDCNSREAWTPAKTSWCCANENKGCPTTPTPPPAPKTCTLWGDPHVISFDQVGEDKNQASSFYGDGDFYVVKSSTVVIQGRFEGTKYTEGLAATNRIAVGGPFLHGHKIEVGTRESGILTVDGQAVLSGFPSSYHGDGFSVYYDRRAEVPDVVPEGNEKRVVRMELPLGVRVNVFQWGNYVDVTIEMTKQPGQDGVCGNFNSNLGDDTTQAIFRRIGARVPAGQSILSGQPKIEWNHQMAAMMAAECAAAKQAEGQRVCGNGLAGDLLNACKFDYCFGMNVRARSHAKTYH